MLNLNFGIKPQTEQRQEKRMGKAWSSPDDYENRSKALQRGSTRIFTEIIRQMLNPKISATESDWSL